MIHQLRNLNDVSIDLSPKINFFYGDNGSGKTSILEAISLLGMGRSFRSHKSRSLVNHEYSELTVFADIQSSIGVTLVTTPVGIQKNRNGKSMIKMAGELVSSAAILAKHLPLQTINASSFLLIEGSPNQRRQFLDWMVFHVKPEFSQLWRALQKILKQRNSLLRRDKIVYSDLHPWDIEFTRLSIAIDEMRERVFNDFLIEFQKLNIEFSESQLQIELEYIKGWDREVSFIECLQADFERDKRDGYTHHGPQRADIKIRARQKAASDVLSRGQEKSLICAMHIAQANLYQRQTQQSCVFLVDDLLAELDELNSKKLARWLTALKGQVFVTGVTKSGMYQAWGKEDTEIATFHVKHGGVKRIT